MYERDDFGLDGKVAIGSNDGRLYVFGAPQKDGDSDSKAGK